MASFLAENVHLIPENGEVLCLGSAAEVEFLEQRGMRVTHLADRARLPFYDFGRRRWDAIVSIGAAIKRDVRLSIHQACVEGLKEGGVFLLEDEAPMTRADVLEELSGLHVTLATESRGVVRLLGRKPQ